MVTAERRRYRAPALEKGLDVLELLADARSPLGTQAIAEALERSRSEIFRMLSVLEERGFIARDAGSDGFVLTTRLLELAMRNPPTLGLLDAALPVMERLAREAGQSCHLAVESGADMVVIARVESPDDIGFAVRVGHRRSLVESSSGLVLLAFRDPEALRASLARVAEERRFDRTALAAELEEVRAKGLRRAKSSYVSGIVDLGVPVLGPGASHAVAALTIPCVQKRTMQRSIAEVAKLLQAAGRTVSDALAVGARRTPIDLAS